MKNRNILYIWENRHINDTNKNDFLPCPLSFSASHRLPKNCDATAVNGLLGKPVLNSEGVRSVRNVRSVRILPHFEYGSGRTMGWGGGGVKDRGLGRRTGKEKAHNNKINIHNKLHGLFLLRRVYYICLAPNYTFLLYFNIYYALVKIFDPTVKRS
jgi:hypothetical protein